MPRAIPRTLWAGLLTILVGGCSTAGGDYTVSVGDKTTLIYGWQYRFGVEFTVDPETPQTRVVRGAVFPLSPNGADRMRLLVQASDGSGHPLSQHLVWLPTGVPGTGGTYFEAKGLPAAAQYRVTVWDYTTIEAPSIRR
jgi:hypothetical protein